MCFSIYFIYQIIYLFNLTGLLARKMFSCVLKLLQDYHFFLTLNKVFDVSNNYIFVYLYEICCFQCLEVLYV